MKQDILIINSYAGSLLIAAQQLRLNIIGSYEDAGYGMDIQRENFPDGVRSFVEKTKDWPKQDLSQAIVFAHPPCKAFSVQSGQARTGTNNKAFQCTIDVMDYAMGQKCKVLAIESVPLALEGAREAHDKYAAKHDYAVFRVLQNACTFALPQWRPRFWILFVRKDLYKRPWIFQHEPHGRTINELVEDTQAVASKQTTNPQLEQALKWQKEALVAAGFTSSQISRFVSGKCGYGYLAAIIKKQTQAAEPLVEIMHQFCIDPRRVKKDFRGTRFLTNVLRILDPNGMAGTVLYDSWWAIHGRIMTYEEYKGVMGFPHDYILPEKTFREYLSHGVCPPVAKWLMGEVLANLSDSGTRKVSSKFSRLMADGEIADFNVNKKAWEEKIKQRELGFDE